MYKVKWVIPKNKYFEQRQHGIEFVEENSIREASRWAQVLVAQRLVIHAGMVRVYRCESVAETVMEVA